MSRPIKKSSHNLFHWLLTVLIKLIALFIATFFSLYLIIIGFILSTITLQSILPDLWLKEINSYLTLVPYFLLIKDTVFSLLNHWYQSAHTWWAMVVGLPLIIIGFFTFLINFFNLYHTIFSSLYNQTHCPLCRN